MKKVDVTKERLKRILLQDKLEVPTRLSEILKLELSEVLSSYMNLQDMKFQIKIGEDGKYQIYIMATASRLYSLTNPTN